jgi:recombination protein RecT
MAGKKEDIQDQAKASIKKQEMNNTITTALSKKSEFVNYVEKNKEQITKALSRQVDVDRFVRMAQTALSLNSGLEDCTLSSLFGVVVQAAQLNLELGNSLGHAYPVPFRNKKTGKKEAQFVIGYQGYIELILRTNKVKTVYAQAVKKNDFFDFEYGTSHFLRHKPLVEGDRGPSIAFYAIAVMVSGEPVFEVMTRDQVERIRLDSPGKDSDMWKNDYDEGGRKTVVRRIQKYLPKTSELARVQQLEDLAASDVAQELDVSKINKDGEIEIPEVQPKATDASFTDVPPPEKKVVDQPVKAAVEAPAPPKEKEPAPQMGMAMKPGKTPADPPKAEVSPPYKNLLASIKEATDKPALNKALIAVAGAFNKHEIDNLQYADLSDVIKGKMDGLKQANSRNR